MSARDLPPFDDDVAAFLDAERRVAPPTPATQARVLGALDARIAAAAGAAQVAGGASATIGAAALARRALPLLGAFVLGGLVTALVLPRRPSSPVERVVEKVIYVDRPAPVAASASPPAPSPSPAPSPAPAAVPDAQPSPGDRLAAERALLDIARGAFASGDAEGALTAIQRHARDFPRGELTEEREALAVKSLVMAGRYDAARARGARFRAQYPRSVMLRSVESALANIP